MAKLISLDGLEHFLSLLKGLFATKDEVGNKVDKEEGKGLSTLDFTTELKNKLDSLNNYDDEEVRGLISGLKNTLDALTGEEDTEGVINTLTEIKNFLNTFKDNEDLATVLSTLENNIHTWVEEYVAGDDVVNAVIDSIEVATNDEIGGLFTEKETEENS